TAPIGRRVPGWALIDSTPATGAYSSLVALSVSSSQTASPALTAAPSGFSQRDSVAWVMDSPAGVTLISTAIGGYSPSTRGTGGPPVSAGSAVIVRSTSRKPNAGEEIVVPNPAA